MFEVVPDGDCDLTLAQEVTCSGGEEGGECTGEVALSGELVQWLQWKATSELHGRRSWPDAALQLLHCLVLCGGAIGTNDCGRWSSSLTAVTPPVVGVTAGASATVLGMSGVEQSLTLGAHAQRGSL